MFGKIKLASGLLGVLTVFCLFLFAIEALGFWALTSTRSGVDDLSNVAITQVGAASQATQQLLDARINLSRAGTRMVRGGPNRTTSSAMPALRSRKPTRRSPR